MGRSACGGGYFFNHLPTSHATLTSPHQLALKDAGIEDRLVDRSMDSYVVDVASHGEAIRKLLSSIGLASTVNYTYVETGYTGTYDRPVSLTDVDRDYYLLSSSDFLNASWGPTGGTIPIINDYSAVVNGAWMVNAAANTGAADSISGGTQDIAETGKVHFIWGTDATYAARHWLSSGCERREDVCLGAPFTFYIEGREISGTSFASPFAFAAYLLAWERMPERTHISAVFDMALGCVEDVGEPGPDADTGLGRLDIGCMAFSVKDVPSCEHGHVLMKVREPVCERYSYWDDMQAPLGLEWGRESFIERAFREIGLQDQVTDRSARAHLAMADEHVSHVNLMGMTATVDYQHISATGDVVDAYGMLASSDLAGLLHLPAGEVFTSDKSQAAGIDSSDVAGGAWIVSMVDEASRTEVDARISHTITYDVGDGNADPLARLAAVERRDGIKQVAATGKVHFFYGLNDDLDGRRAHSDGCMHIETHCIGVPTHYMFKPPSGSPDRIVSFRGNAAGGRLGYSFYLTAWERMPQTVTVENLFEVVRGCVEDIGAAGADADTGLGRLDLGCLTREAYSKNNPSAPVASTVVVPVPVPESSQLSLEPDQLSPVEPSQLSPAAASPPGDPDVRMRSYMDDFAQGLFGDRLGYLYLPGSTAAGLQVGFPGDSFKGTYRPAQGRKSPYQGAPFESLRGLLRPGLGIVVAGHQFGAYHRLAGGLRAEALLGRGESFFGGSGSGEFEFGCTTDLRLALSGDVQMEEDSTIELSGWLQQSQAGCIRGQLLDRLSGREAGIRASYTGRRGDWKLQASAWASRFVGGEIEMGGHEFPIGSSDTAYGGQVRISYQF